MFADRRGLQRRSRGRGFGRSTRSCCSNRSNFGVISSSRKLETSPLDISSQKLRPQKSAKSPTNHSFSSQRFICSGLFMVPNPPLPSFSTARPIHSAPNDIVLITHVPRKSIPNHISIMGDTSFSPTRDVKWMRRCYRRNKNHSLHAVNHRPLELGAFLMTSISSITLMYIQIRFKFCAFFNF